MVICFKSRFEPDWTPNTSDDSGRYCYKNQPQIGAWNLTAFANALLPLMVRAVCTCVEFSCSMFANDFCYDLFLVHSILVLHSTLICAIVVVL